MSLPLKLYSYWRSSASYRVRIALALKGMAYETVPVHLVKDGGAQYTPEYRALNPQQRVPFLLDGSFGVGQSLAILDYLEAKQPSPALVPADAQARARMLSFCHAIASDIQPLQNLGPLGYLTGTLGLSEEQKLAWLKHWIDRGLAALEAEWQGDASWPFVMGEQPSWADCCLVPQMYAAERFGGDVARYPRLQALAQRLRTLPAFAAAHPEVQPDAQV